MGVVINSPLLSVLSTVIVAILGVLAAGFLVVFLAEKLVIFIIDKWCLWTQVGREFFYFLDNRNWIKQIISTQEQKVCESGETNENTY